eukprot:CAMPEP_0175130936 /NCGR_PEP_ID=MMETSP0087-20121206/6267_1 /TAXON_ID=136419 /ORGANISM="Unknown Unknown, Strain D1" /LENGTH=669 /DNA_ID=CAMNT_0016413177 /DNA_START=95 /DNA_END=2105 /DNA_ORIENTATION=-
MSVFHISLNSRPTCPSILIPYENELFNLPVYKLRSKVDICLSTAFVEIRGVWVNIANYKSDCVFVLPLNGTVTSVKVEVGNRKFQTSVVPNSDTQNLEEKKDDRKADDLNNSLLSQDFGQYVPNLFRLPIPDVNSKEPIKVTVVVIEPLQFYEGKYQFNLPLRFGSNLLPKNKTMDDVISIDLNIRSSSSDVYFESSTHKLIRKQAEQKDSDFSVHLEALEFSRPDPDVPSETISEDFDFSYGISTTKITAAMIRNPENLNNFLLFVLPPTRVAQKSNFTRHMVFLLDRSGSMIGEPHSEATRALGMALRNLSPTDKFTVVVFDHEMLAFSDDLLCASPANVTRAIDWVTYHQPNKGGTYFGVPLAWALEKLNTAHALSFSIPFVVLLTDGCVRDEREICKMVEETCAAVRILTFGIGSYCNMFFLKMLAKIGRGFSDVVVYKEKVFSQITRLINMASVPIITNCTLSVEGATKVVTYPDPIPDLFLGAPLTLSGNFEGDITGPVQLWGQTGDNVRVSIPCDVVSSTVIPVEKVLIQQQISLMTADAWLNEDEGVEENVVNLSCKHNVASAYTSMVAYELLDGEDDNDDAQGDGKDDDDDTIKQHHKKLQRAKVAAMVLTTGTVIAAASFSFGDVLGTSENMALLGIWAVEAVAAAPNVTATATATATV